MVMLRDSERLGTRSGSLLDRAVMDGGSCNTVLVIAFLTGCPFCAMPNMDWPRDLVREIRTSEYDQDLVTEHRRVADDTWRTRIPGLGHGAAGILPKRGDNHRMEESYPATYGLNTSIQEHR